MRLLLVRHAPCRANEEHRYAGRGTDDPVSEAGLCALGRAGSYPHARLVFTSTLLRARQTARSLFPCAHIEECAGLDECDFGDFEGHNAQELATDARWQAWVDSGCTTCPPGGESRDAFTARVADALAGIVCREHARGASLVACVCHAGTIMAAMATFAGPAPEGDDYFGWNVGHLGACMAEAEAGPARIRLKNPVLLDSVAEALRRLDA